MDLLVEMLHREISELDKNNVKLHAIGDLKRLPEKTRKELEDGIRNTSDNTGLNLILAVSYGGRAEIVNAAKTFAMAAVSNPSLIEKLDEDAFSKYLYTASYPEPEMIIRTGGDMRTSNFLIWQAAYAELIVSDILWPDFNKDGLVAAIEDFNSRERRFGRIPEQK
jgi:undecaprenyl diphosphate synthase